MMGPDRRRIVVMAVAMCAAGCGPAVQPPRRIQTLPPGYILHHVTPGDTFEAIAEYAYGDRALWPHIADANPDVADDGLRGGDELLLPWPPPRPDVPVMTSEKTTYVVRAGDLGYWQIAKEVYGDGRFHPLIAAANPGVNPMALRPGQKLRIPLRPDPAHDLQTRFDRAPVGSTLYLVQDGDHGYWWVAEKVYGDGNCYPLIKATNPGVDPWALTPGVVLVIAPRPYLPVTNEMRTYLVQPGDLSLWQIAENIYGDGRYHHLISAANPIIDSGALTPGTALTIALPLPPLAEGKK